MMPLIIQNLDMLNSNNNSDKNKTGSRNNNENTNHSSGPSQQSTSMEEVTNSQEEEQQEKDNPSSMDPVNSKEMGVKAPELVVKAADLGVQELQADQGKEDQAEKDEDLQDQVLQGNLESQKAEEPQHAEDTNNNNQLKSLGASSLHEDDDDEDDEEGGAYIVVGDNDSVSSLDSTDSFAYESLSEAEDQDSRMRRPRRRRRRRPNQQDQQHAEHQLQQLRRPTKRDEQQQLNNHTPASQRRVLRRSRVAASKVAGPIRAKTSPNMPRRQKTREVGSGGAAAATPKRYTPRSLQRNFSNPELLSPGSDSDHKANHHTDLPTPRESLQSVSQSVHSLNHLELWNDDSHDNHIRNDNSAMERWNDSGMQDSSDLHHALSMHSGDNSDATNAGSRWSASASTGHRSMNTAQLDQLSTVPRFPRRQKTGENMHRARQQVVQQQRQASRDGQDNNSTTAASNNNNNNSHVNPRESVSSTTTTKKRPQLPNRQKSFRRNVMTMNQAAQAALAIAEQNNNNNNNGGNLSPNSHAPSMPRRSVSGDTSCTGSFSRQKSLPNLRPNRHNPCGTLDAAEKELLSISLHQEKKPRLPERKASRRPRRGSATGTSNNTHNTSTSRSPHAIAKGTRIRRAKSDGVRKVNIGNLLQDIQDDDSEFANNNNNVNAADLQSSWSAASFGVEEDGDQPKMPRRQASRDDMPAPPSVAAAVLAAGSSHNYQYESANNNNNNAKIPERIPSASTAWSTNTARMSLMGGGSVSDGHTVASSQYGDGPRSRASGTSDLISLSLHSTASLSLPNKPLRQGTDENFQYTPRAGGEVMSNNSKQSISSTTVEGPKMPRRQVSHDDENEKGPPMRRLDTINSVGVDAEEEPVDLDHEEEENEEDEDAGNLGDHEDDDDDTFADDDDDDEDEDEEGQLDSMSELPDLPPSRRLSDAAPPRSLNLVHHNASMSTLDESNNSHLHHSSGQKSLKVGRTSSTTTATTTASTLSGNTKSTSGGGDSLIRLPKRQVSNSESRQHAEADTGGTNNDNDMTIVEEADEGDEDVVKSVNNNLEASSTLANATLSAAAASEGDQVFAEAAASS